MVEFTNSTTADSKEHPHVALIHKFYNFIGQGNMEKLRTILKEDIVWHLAGKSPLAGEWQGVDDIFLNSDSIGATVLRLGDGAFGSELLHVFANDIRAVSITRDYYTGEGNHFDLRLMLFFAVEDGQIAEIWEVPFDQYEFDRFFNLQQERLSKVADAHVTQSRPSPSAAQLIATAKRYIELSNRGTTIGMETIFALGAVYEGGSDHPSATGTEGFRVEGRGEILRTHQDFFDGLQRGTWTVPDENYVLTAPNVVEFDIVNVTLIPHDGESAAHTAHEVMRFNNDGLVVHVGGYVKESVEPT